MFETLALLTVQLFESCDCDIHIVKNRARLNSKETIFYAEEEIAQSTAHLVTPQTDALRRTLFFWFFPPLHCHYRALRSLWISFLHKFTCTCITTKVYLMQSYPCHTWTAYILGDLHLYVQDSVCLCGGGETGECVLVCLGVGPFVCVWVCLCSTIHWLLQCWCMQGLATVNVFNVQWVLLDTLKLQRTSYV